MALGPIIQAYKIYRAKSSKNVSRFMFSYVGFGCFLWLVWGLLSSNAPLIVANIVGTIGYAMCVASIFIWNEEGGATSLS
jgi:uncharacterized protein with PQ loop repeat